MEMNRRQCIFFFLSMPSFKATAKTKENRWKRERLPNNLSLLFMAVGGVTCDVLKRSSFPFPSPSNERKKIIWLKDSHPTPVHLFVQQMGVEVRQKKMAPLSSCFYTETWFSENQASIDQEMIFYALRPSSQINYRSIIYWWFIVLFFRLPGGGDAKCLTFIGSPDRICRLFFPTYISHQSKEPLHRNSAMKMLTIGFHTIEST